MKAFNKVHNISKFSSFKKWEQSSLQHLIKHILIVIQCFALLPVNGVTKNVKSLKFKWISFKVCYTCTVIILLTMYSSCICHYCIYYHENFISFVIVIWNVRALLGIIVLLRLASKWSVLLQQWSDMELNMINHGPLTNMKLRFHLTCFAFFITGIVEHGLFVYGGIRTTMATIKENEPFVKSYFEILYVEFFNTFEYASWKAVMVEFLVFISTFGWQLYDLLLVLLSSALALRFQQINKMIKCKSLILSEVQWKDLRNQYNGLALVCRTSNATLSEVTLLSFFGNAYFLSTSIFQCFTINTRYELLYSWYAVLFHFFHLLIVCIYASWVHEESLESLTEIASVPTRNMSHELDRLLYQMAAKDIAIYGGGLFKITRGVVLNIMSAVVTIQLIFVQFNAKILSKIK